MAAYICLCFAMPAYGLLILCLLPATYACLWLLIIVYGWLGLFMALFGAVGGLQLLKVADRCECLRIAADGCLWLLMEMLDRNAGATLWVLRAMGGFGGSLMEILDRNPGATSRAFPGNGWLWWESDGDTRPEPWCHTSGSPGQWMAVLGI